jgi:alcohol dehydrogenase, propanol-preferring
MVLDAPRKPLRLDPEYTAADPGPGELRLRVRACGVCRTDLHILDGELPHPKLPLVLGHEIVGEVVAMGAGVAGWRVGDRVGVPWLGHTCGECEFCRSGRENLCDRPRFTGYDRDGGYAEFAVAEAAYCLRIPDRFSDVSAAPLLCAGLIGYRALRLAGAAHRIGLYGFGASANLVAQVARHRDQEVFAFTRPGDTDGRAFARRLGAEWAGGSDEPPPRPLDAAIIFASVGDLVPTALRATAKGGTVVCAGIHMSDLPSFPYDLLWGERVVRSVANLTRQDGQEFLPLAGEIPLRTSTVEFPLEAANEAVDRVRHGRIEGSAVLVP